ncbi:MAG: sugar transferase [Sphingobacteriia bacterium]|nr:sugar transferase [Sphingobacteriia bacterium]
MKLNYSARKRLLDLSFAFLLLFFVFSWLFPLIAILIRLTSKGPVFFIQSRSGCNGQIINCYKFRTMVYTSQDVCDNGMYLQATPDDFRVTLFGKFLRKTSLDELPQIWNVLMGEMSLVGPRPHPLPLDKECEDTIENYKLRYLVKPGITGWAQVNGARGGTQTIGAMQRRIDLDIWYIQHWSFKLDLKIVLLTFWKLIKGDQNAY